MKLLLLIACTSAPERPAEPPANPTWLDVIAQEPGRFEDQMGADGRSGWIALHAGRPADAWGEMTSEPGRRRAARELAGLYRALANAHTRAAVALAEEWPDAPLPVKAAGSFAADCTVEPESPELRERFAAYADAGSLPGVPVWTIEAESFTRRIHDPCEEHARAVFWESRTGAIDGLPGTLFGPLPLERTPADDAQAARDDLLRIRRELERIEARHVDDPVLSGLEATEVAAIRTATAFAEEALSAEHAEYARVLLDLARSPDARAISARSPARSFAVHAAAEVAAGRPRRALDLLAPLGDRAAGVRETVSDLAVLRGLSRVGDSKEE